MRNLARAVVAVAALATVPMFASPALAHEEREVGEHTFVVGWYDEPAFANAKNGPEVTITEANGDPVVEEVELQVEIGFEGETMTADLEPAFVVGVFGEPGNYTADIYPTRAGTYTFHITGAIHGEEVDETFTSGPDTFGDIEDPAEVAFPVQDPSVAELSDQVEQLSSGEGAVSEDDVSSAKTLAYVGIAVGALGLIVAIVAVMRRRTA